MIQLYTGDGKGKTTAAIGQAVRAAGAGYQVIFAQFMKGNDSSELRSLKQLKEVRILRSDKEFGFYHTLSEEEKTELTKIHDTILDEVLQAIVQEACDMVILDEITYPVSWGLCDSEKLKRILAFSDEKRELILTGRNAAPFLAECADYITQMQCVRHPFEKGVSARRGIEL